MLPSKEAKGDDRFILPSESYLAEYVASKLNIIPVINLKYTMKQELFSYKRSAKTYPSSKVVLDMDEQVQSTPEASPTPTLIPPSPKRRKSLQDTSKKQVKRRTEDIWDAVQTLVQKENVKTSELLGVLLTRCGSSIVKDIGEMLWEDDLSDNKKLPLWTLP